MRKIDWPVITSYKASPSFDSRTGLPEASAFSARSRAESAAPSTSAIAIPGHSRIVTSVGRKLLAGCWVCSTNELATAYVTAEVLP